MIKKEHTINNVKENKEEEMKQTIIAAMQTIESIEENNSDLHAKIDHLGQLAINAEDMRLENSRLKTCEHCRFEFITEQSFKEHITQLLEHKAEGNTNNDQ